MTAKIIYTGVNRPRYDDWYVVPPVYPRVGEYFGSLGSAKEYCRRQGWKFTVEL
jgi:hypothetical protein